MVVSTVASRVIAMAWLTENQMVALKVGMKELDWADYWVVAMVRMWVW